MLLAELDGGAILATAAHSGSAVFATATYTGADAAQ